LALVVVVQPMVLIQYFLQLQQLAVEVEVLQGLEMLVVLEAVAVALMWHLELVALELLVKVTLVEQVLTVHLLLEAEVVQVLLVVLVLLELVAMAVLEHQIH
jgi:hypothetical protein